MKSNRVNVHAVSMFNPTNDDLSDPNNLKAVHSIEAILGIKNVEHHHQQQTKSSPSQHPLAAHLARYSHAINFEFDNEKRQSHRHCSDGM
jgi:hypothetical protein